MDERLSTEEDFLDIPKKEIGSLLDSYQKITEYFNKRGIACYLGMNNFISNELIIGKNPKTGNEFRYDPNGYLQKTGLKSLEV